MKNVPFMTIGTLSKKTGCHIESLRKYERQGLIPAPLRTNSGHRRYTRHHESVVNVILKLRRANFAIKDIKSILDDLNQSHAPCGRMERHTLTYAQLIESNRKALDEAEAMIEEIGNTCITCHKRDQSVIINDCPLMINLKAQGV